MKLFIKNYNDVLTSVMESGEVELAPVPEHAEAIVVADEHQGGKQAVAVGKANGIPTIVMQHGHLATRCSYMPPYSLPMVADKFLAWGQLDYDNMRSLGHSDEKLAITGTSVFDLVKSTEKKLSDEVVVSYFPIKIRGNVPSMFTVLDAIMEAGHKVIVKLRSFTFEDEKFFEYERKNSNCKIVISDDIADSVEIINRSHVMVSSYDGTPSLMACVKDVPIVHVDTGVGTPFSQVGYLIKRNLGDIAVAIKVNLDDPGIYKLTRESMALDAIDLSGDATEKILNEIRKSIEGAK